MRRGMPPFYNSTLRRRMIPHRWVVKRIFAWLSHRRRLSKDYERLTITSEAWTSLGHEPPHAAAACPLVGVFRFSHEKQGQAASLTVLVPRPRPRGLDASSAQRSNYG